MLKLRNDLTHDYDGDIARQSCNIIIKEYIDLFYKLQDKIENLHNSEMQYLNVW